MSATSINLSPSTVYELISGEKGRNSTTIKIYGVCDSFAKPTLRLVSMSIANRVTVVMPTSSDINVKPTSSGYEYEASITINALDNVFASNIIVTFGADSLTTALTIDHVRMRPSWKLPTEAYEIPTGHKVYVNLFVTDFDDQELTEDLITITHSDNITELEYTIDHDDIMISYVANWTSFDQRDNITMKTQATNMYVAKSMTCAIQYREAQGWNISPEAETLPVTDTGTHDITFTGNVPLPDSLRVYGTQEVGSISFKDENRSHNGYADIDVTHLHDRQVVRYRLNSNIRTISKFPAHDTFFIYSAGDDRYAPRYVQFNITINDDKYKQLWTVAPTSCTLYTNSESSETFQVDDIDKVHGSLKVYNKYGFKNRSDKELLSINTNGLDHGYIVVSLNEDGRGLTTDDIDSFEVYAAGDDNYQPKSINIKCNIKYSAKYSRTLEIIDTNTGNDIGNRIELDISSVGYEKEFMVKFAGGDSATIISPVSYLVDKTMAQNLTIFKVSLGLIEVNHSEIFTVNLPETTSYLAESRTVHVYVTESGSEPEELIDEPEAKIIPTLGYRISRQLLPSWHSERSVLSSDYVDLSKILVSENYLATWPKDYYHLVDDTLFARFTYNDALSQDVINLSTYFTEPSYALNHNFILSGQNTLFGKVFDYKIYNQTKISITRNSNDIVIGNDTTGQLVKMLAPSNFKDNAIPKSIYLLACGRGGAAGYFDETDANVGDCIVGTAGSGAAGALFKIDLSVLNKLYIILTSDNLLINDSGNISDAWSHKLGNGLQGNTIRFNYNGNGHLLGTVKPVNKNGGGYTLGDCDGIEIIRSFNGGNIWGMDSINYAVDFYGKVGGNVLRDKYNPLDSEIAGHYFPGGTYAGGKASNAWKTVHGSGTFGNGGGASGVSAGIDSCNYTNLPRVDTYPGAGHGAVYYEQYSNNYTENVHKSIAQGQGGPAYFAILY